MGIPPITTFEPLAGSMISIVSSPLALAEHLQRMGRKPDSMMWRSSSAEMAMLVFLVMCRVDLRPLALIPNIFHPADGLLSKPEKCTAYLPGLREFYLNSVCTKRALPNAASRAVLSKMHHVGTPSAIVASTLWTKRSSHSVS